MPTAVITGACSGLGLSIASFLASKGYDLIVTTRQSQHDFSSWPVQVQVLTIDLCQPGGPKKLADYCQDKDVKLLVNNAGYGLYGSFVQSDIEDSLSMVDLNCRVVSELCYYFGQMMNSGRIVNVASAASFVAGPYMAVYYATKAYVLSFTKALSQEWKHRPLSIHALCPGPMPTGFAGRAKIESNTSARLFSWGGIKSPEQVAKHILDRPTIITVGWISFLARLFGWLAPLTLLARINGVDQDGTD